MVIDDDIVLEAPRPCEIGGGALARDNTFCQALTDKYSGMVYIQNTLHPF
jgi:hypothetical protein